MSFEYLVNKSFSFIQYMPQFSRGKKFIVHESMLGHRKYMDFFISFANRTLLALVLAKFISMFIRICEKFMFETPAPVPIRPPFRSPWTQWPSFGIFHLRAFPGYTMVAVCHPWVISLVTVGSCPASLCSDFTLNCHFESQGHSNKQEFKN